MTYYDGKGENFNILINKIPYVVRCEGENSWKTKIIEIEKGFLEPDNNNSHITIQSGAKNIYLHMVEVVR